MKTRFLSMLLLLLGCNTVGEAEETVAPKRQFVSLNVDRVVIETQGLSEASAQLADSVEKLAAALQQLSTDSEALSDADRQVLLDAVKSVDEASTALARLANELPQTAQQLSRQLPQMVENARQPIAELSSGLQSARDGIYAITETLPQATDNAKDLVNSALDSALVKISTYTILLIALLALALVAVVWFIYRQYLAPIAAKLEPLAVAPEHFAELARHMNETSSNLLVLQSASKIHDDVGETTKEESPQTQAEMTAVENEKDPGLTDKPD